MVTPTDTNVKDIVATHLQQKKVPYSIFATRLLGFKDISGTHLQQSKKCPIPIPIPFFFFCNLSIWIKKILP
jgi:hypothetical protein